MDVLLALASTTIFALMLTIGLNHSVNELLIVWRQPIRMMWALIAVLVVVPIVAALLILVFELSPGTASGLALLAAAPGAPLTTKRAQVAGAETPYIAGLQLTLAVLAVFVTPLILSLFYSFFDLSIERASIGFVARQIGVVTVVPVLLGLSVKRVFPAFAKKVRTPLNKISDWLFLILLAVAVIAVVAVPGFREKLLIGWPAFFALLLFSLLALAAGHLIGGPARNRKSALAIACLARNIGLAIYLAGVVTNTYEVLPTILAYALLGATVGVPYSIWTKRSGNS
jgi:BASS family bile acid:Na+ symporter